VELSHVVLVKTLHMIFFIFKSRQYHALAVPLL
jgi:hypothetical protein